ncbi:MAG: sigma-54 dependent transcriptional regulator [Gammaproteobacteria bacterium]|nr:sigma-54 dependent transcriptional regulator [Gammaproteobacteria bacterium]
MSQPLALIVDDEPDICELLDITLARMDIRTRSASTLAAARAELRSHQFDLCLTDMRLPDGNGIELVRHIQAREPALPVAMITAHGNMELAIEALKAGAFDFISKPVELEALRALVASVLRLRTAPGLSVVPRLVGESALIEQTRAKVSKLSRSQAPVYISGESGTGKELVARMIHEQGPRSDHAFVPVNCGAIPPELMESEFFGHKKGSFTGAFADKAGLFQVADGGTLFLDEVADLPLSMQVKLLRAIQEKSVRPVGAAQETRVDVRVLSATHKDLATLVQDGDFRQDLFYRINVIEIRVPALRDRPGDIVLLCDHILMRLAQSHDVAVPRLSEEARARLATYEFPGNVRELENILERAMTLCEDNIIAPEDLGLTDAVSTGMDMAGTEPGATSGDVEVPVELDTALEDVQRERILNALNETRWNRTAAARMLGISFPTLRYRMQKLGVKGSNQK